MPKTTSEQTDIPHRPLRSAPGIVPVSSTYRVMWTRAGQDGRLDHLVAATSPASAQRISRAEMRAALGPEFPVWRINAVL